MKIGEVGLGWVRTVMFRVRELEVRVLSQEGRYFPLMQEMKILQIGTAMG